MTVIAVTGTGTEVGKTFVAAAVAVELRVQGVAVHARKPVQSFLPGDETDADVLAAATGEDPHEVCPAHRWFPTAMAPPMAAAALGEPAFTIADLVGELRVPAGGTTIVEGAGGLRSPLADDGDTRTLIEACDPDAVLLVANAGLGTIHDVRLCAEALGGRRRLLVYLNRFDGLDRLHVRNAEWLRTRDGLEVFTDLEAISAVVAAIGR